MRLSEADPSGRRTRRRAWQAALEMIVALALVVGVGLGVAACTFETGTESTSTTGSPITTGATSSSTTRSTIGNGGSNGLPSPAQDVATILGPSVVNIAVSGTTNPGAGGFGGQEYAGEGSGVIYRADGMIITNNHVVTDVNGDPVDDIEVTLATGEKLPATVVGTDVLTDLAIIKVNPTGDLPVAEFVTASPAVGEYAVAIGSPLGFENSVTLGIVSGLARSIEGVEGPEGVALTNLIQTDAPISPGNSGGALGNASGQVIGINVAYLPPGTTGAVNIGFAIPSVVATQVADQIIATGKATHAYIGIGTQTITTQLQQQFGLSRDTGILVAEVRVDGPAGKAGMQQGDIIISIDDQEMVESSNVLTAIRDKQPGDQVQVKIDRDGTELVIEVTLEERPADL